MRSVDGISYALTVATYQTRSVDEGRVRRSLENFAARKVANGVANEIVSRLRLLRFSTRSKSLLFEVTDLSSIHYISPRTFAYPYGYISGYDPKFRNVVYRDEF